MANFKEDVNVVLIIIFAFYFLCLVFFLFFFFFLKGYFADENTVIAFVVPTICCTFDCNIS